MKSFCRYTEIHCWQLRTLLENIRFDFSSLRFIVAALLLFITFAAAVDFQSNLDSSTIDSVHFGISDWSGSSHRPLRNLLSEANNFNDSILAATPYADAH